MAPASEHATFKKSSWARTRQNGTTVLALLLEAKWTAPVRTWIERAVKVLAAQFEGGKLGLNTPALPLTQELLQG